MTATPFPHVEYTVDPDGHPMLLQEKEYQIMMAWERSYMEACIAALGPFGDVLEVGFGCGYAADAIQQYAPRTHVIIEYHPVVAVMARRWALGRSGVQVMEATWQHALANVGVFDSIFFDDGLRMAEDQACVQDIPPALPLQRSCVGKIWHRMLPWMRSVSYSDEDLLRFLEKSKYKSSAVKKRYPRFFQELYRNGQITLAQWYMVMARVRQMEGGPVASPAQGHPSDVRAVHFLLLCLQHHMRVGSRFSCSVTHPISKFEDPLFLDHIVLRSDVEYTERWVPVNVSAHCKYYHSEEALVMIIKKLESCHA